ncbi:MAG: PIG-L family deacetylase [Chloroflexi bacterium]|nr:PIG-L family deacetylase [Chloroflexota bacterium]
MDIPKKVLVIVAHPDDAEFGCAGTLAKWINEGSEVHYILCSSGDKGINNGDINAAELALLREQEQEAAAAVLGVKGCTFLRHKDAEIEVNLSLRAELVRLIRQHRPEAVMTHDPWLHYQLHPDHRAVGFVAVDAVASARDRLFHLEQLVDGLGVHRTKEIYLFRPQEPNLWVDITTTIEKKIAALSKHQSQLSHIEGLEERVQRWSALMGEEKGMPLAEAFRRMELF